MLDPRERSTVRSTVFVEITLSGQSDEILAAFEREVALIPDVLECHLMAGTADYLLKVCAMRQRRFRPHPPPLSRPPARGREDALVLLAEVGSADDGAAGLSGATYLSPVSFSRPSRLAS
jgi:hypothetical protein